MCQVREKQEEIEKLNADLRERAAKIQVIYINPRRMNSYINPKRIDSAYINPKRIDSAYIQIHSRTYI